MTMIINNNIGNALERSVTDYSRRWLNQFYARAILALGSFTFLLHTLERQNLRIPSDSLLAGVIAFIQNIGLYRDILLYNAMT